MAPNAPKQRLRLARWSKGLVGWEDPAQMLAVPPTSRFWGSSHASNSLIAAKLSRPLLSAADREPEVVWQLPVSFLNEAESTPLLAGQQAIAGRGAPCNEAGFWGALDVEHPSRAAACPACMPESAEPVPVLPAHLKDGGSGEEVEEETPRCCSPRCR